MTEGTDTFARFNVTLTGTVAPGEDVTVDFTTNDGTAVDGQDFTAQSGTITLNSANTSQHIDVLITDDAIIEATEVFNVVLSNVQSNVGIGFADGNSTNTATGNILDNDAVPGTGISFDNTDVTVNEDAGTATFTVRLTGNVDGGFTLDYASADGSAMSPDDYTTQSGQLNFTGTDNESYEIVVPIIDDLFIEATEDYVVNLSNLNTTLININTPQANGGIIDNDMLPGSGISFDNTDVIVNEDAGTATFTVRLSGNVDGGFTLDYASADGSAISPDDYTAQSGQLTFTGTDGESYDIIVPIIDDLVIEDTEGYVINLSNLSTTVIMINTPQANGGIIDDDMRMIISSDYAKEYMLLCGDAIPEVPELTFSGGCGDYQVDFTEIEESSDASNDFMIIRTWNVTDACGNTASFEQIIFVMQLEKELVTIDICVEDNALDLIPYLPENFDTNGDFTITQGVANMNGSFFNPANLELGEYVITYTSTVGSCTYMAEYTITVNADCVQCSEEDVIVSTAVTPNGDGFNDLFTITGAENCFFTYDVMIFNRWGNKIFEAKDYQNDWGGSAPNGSFGTNVNLPSGTYYYIINVTSELNLKPINGYIYLGTK